MRPKEERERERERDRERDRERGRSKIVMCNKVFTTALSGIAKD